MPSDCRRMSSKKHSNSQPEDLTFFIDRCLGKEPLASSLRALNWKVDPRRSLRSGCARPALAGRSWSARLGCPVKGQTDSFSPFRNGNAAQFDVPGLRPDCRQCQQQANCRRLCSGSSQDSTDGERAGRTVLGTCLPGRQGDDARKDQAR